jgi:glycosyltransferase involved in cell wall biosynthesis
VAAPRSAPRMRRGADLESVHPPRILVVTTVHAAQDARIFRREIGALLDAGWSVTYAAPFTQSGGTPKVSEGVRLRTIDLPRSVGRKRLHALRAARRVIRREAPRQDVVLFHDPELLLAVLAVRGPVVVWDVHEDTAAALSLKAWLPWRLRPAVAALVHSTEKLAEWRVRILLADDGYRSRFAHWHPVVPNSTPVPTSVVPPGDDRVVYVGHVTLARGAAELVATARVLAGSGVSCHIIGHADAAATALLEAAQAEGLLVWHGFIPNVEALELINGALAGLSLVHDEPNYADSMQTKVLEYMAHGVPVVTTPVAPAKALVEANACGLVVPFGNPAEVGAAAAAAVLELRDNPDQRIRFGAAGHAATLRDYDWNKDGVEFASVLQKWVAARDR